MQAAARPRHPWKAFAVVLLVFAVVHGAGAHAGLRGHASSHLHVVHADGDCPHVDIDVEEDGPEDDPVLDVFDDDWS
jgi:hypothetical protein